MPDPGTVEEVSHAQLGQEDDVLGSGLVTNQDVGLHLALLINFSIGMFSMELPRSLSKRLI